MFVRAHPVLKWLLLFTLFVMCTGLIFPTRKIALAGERPIAVVLNGSPVLLSTPPVVIDGQVFLPLRELFAALETPVTWIPESQAIVAHRAQIVVALKIGRTVAEVDGTDVALTAAPRLVKGKVIVPLRAVAALFGADVAYSGRTVTISLAPLEGNTTPPGRYYELIDECARGPYEDRWVWAKCFMGPREIYADKAMRLGETITIVHLERLKLLAIHLPEPDESRAWLDPRDTRILELQNEKGQIGWTTISDYLSVDRFDYKAAIEKEFYLEDPRRKYKWPSEAWKLIETNRIQIGMTPDMVKLSWGEPRRVNRSIYTFGVHEQWVYGDFGPYVYFEDGRLTAIQN